MGSKQSSSILLVTPDFAGPTRGGGIGTAFYYLACFLRDEGYDVHVLYCLPDWTDDGSSLDEWKETLKKQNITLHSLPERTRDIAQLSTCWHAKTAMEVAELAYRLHQKYGFTAIHMPEWGGFGYFIIKGKREQKAFAGAELIVQTHSPTSWHRRYNHEAMDSLALVQIDAMERYSVAQADQLISPSRYMLDWLQQEGWKLAETRQVIPNLYKPEQQAGALTGQEINEIVLFGRLEIRKGVDLFLDSVANINHNKYKITLLGKDAEIKGELSSDHIKQRAEDMGLKVTIVTGHNQQQALDYVKQPGRLTVIASLQENLPYVAYECLAEGVPCLLSDAGGTAELVAEESRDILFTPEVEVLAQKINQTVKQMTQTGQLAFSQDDVQASWRALHDASPTLKKQASPAAIDLKALYEGSPLSWKNRAELLQQTSFAEELLAGLLEERHYMIDAMHAVPWFTQHDRQDDVRVYGEWLKDAVEENNKKIIILEKKNETLREEQLSTSEYIDALTHSTSWRITAPLRAAIHWLRRIFSAG